MMNSNSAIDSISEECVRIAKNNEMKNTNGNHSSVKTCMVCGKVSANATLARMHMKIHTGEKNYECEVCQKRFIQSSQLKVHLARHRNEKRFKCNACDYASVSKEDIVRHNFKHTKIPTCYCEICGRGFSHIGRLRHHIRFVHEKNESLVCEICGHKTHGKHLLATHKKLVHNEQQKQICPVCNVVLKTRHSFLVHLRSHVDYRPHKCETCNKSFVSSSMLWKHKAFHNEGKFNCEHCSKKFKTSDHLRRHLIIHSGEKPFSCHLCDYRCNVKANLNKHVKTVHKVLDFGFKEIRRAQPQEELDKEKSIAYANKLLNDFSKQTGNSLTLEELKEMEADKRRQIMDNLQEKKRKSEKSKNSSRFKNDETASSKGGKSMGILDAAIAEVDLNSYATEYNNTINVIMIEGNENVKVLMLTQTSNPIAEV
ncbi:zinc finger protein 35-like protein [Dinothrombium tinctorium]|uniref:Zinc finger protein 35-like protein n=1 Tax=Dinothrombium tinctorium TaxID=1965070 RepID=A0A3S3NT65_9ACAR|nr:zinc finger protein 35-like protein [Dinothrombium tinctorium]